MPQLSIHKGYIKKRRKKDALASEKEKVKIPSGSVLISVKLGKRKTKKGYRYEIRRWI